MRNEVQEEPMNAVSGSMSTHSCCLARILQVIQETLPLSQSLKEWHLLSLSYCIHINTYISTFTLQSTNIKQIIINRRNIQKKIIITYKQQERITFN